MIEDLRCPICGADISDPDDRQQATRVRTRGGLTRHEAVSVCADDRACRGRAEAQQYRAWLVGYWAPRVAN